MPKYRVLGSFRWRCTDACWRCGAHMVRICCCALTRTANNALHTPGLLPCTVHPQLYLLLVVSPAMCAVHLAACGAPQEAVELATERSGVFEDGDVSGLVAAWQEGLLADDKVRRWGVVGTW